MKMQIVISKTTFFTFFHCPQWCLVFLIMSMSVLHCIGQFRKKTKRGYGGYEDMEFPGVLKK